MLTRRLLVKGLKYVITNNSFKARMVFFDIDPNNKNKCMEQEEEMQVDEASLGPRQIFQRGCSAHYQYAP
jgi:hypothetical protein